jgi:hypothetical protein
LPVHGEPFIAMTVSPTFTGSFGFAAL